jgi:predicted transcriptional regulator of viral defense system
VPMMAQEHADHLLPRIVGEYHEMPGLRLTLRQAQRLWALDERTLRELLHALVKQKFLTRLRDGSYVRRDSARYRVPRPFDEHA